MRKTIFFAFLLFVCSSQSVFAQAQDEFYNILKQDFKSVKAVVYVDVKARKLVDSMGSADCENDKGAGYCLYELTAEVKEIFKGKIKGKTLKFYTSPDADFPKKHLMGEKVVFLNLEKSKTTNKKEYFTLENSSRPIENGILSKLLRIKRTSR